MEVLGWIFVAILLIVLLPVLLPVVFGILGVFIEILVGIFDVLFDVLGGLFALIGVVLFALFGGLFALIGGLIELVVVFFLFVGKSLFMPLLILGALLERKWRRLERQTVAALAGVLVFVLIVLLAYLTQAR